jgi:disulfide bond formation protein DsbB
MDTMPNPARQFFSTRTLAILTALGAAAALGVAHASEIWDGLVPCALCLLQRWPYRVVIVLTLLATILPVGLARALLIVAALVLLVDAGIAAVHVGVEFRWWPSPLPECAAPRFSGGSIAERLAAMPERPAKPCEDASFLIPGLPVSMAAMNMLYALAFSAFIAMSLAWTRTFRR